MGVHIYQLKLLPNHEPYIAIMCVRFMAQPQTQQSIYGSKKGIFIPLRVNDDWLRERERDLTHYLEKYYMLLMLDTRSELQTVLKIHFLNKIIKNQEDFQAEKDANVISLLCTITRIF